MSPGYPYKADGRAGFEQIGGGSYGVNNGLFGRNYENNGAVEANTSAVLSQIENVASKVIISEKGAVGPDKTYFYPWFHEWQKYWIWDIFPTDGDPTNPTRDGVDVYTVGRPGYDPDYDRDCPSGNDRWECGAHPRYRFSQTAPMAFADGHAKAIKKGAIKWFENIFFDRRNLQNNYSWYYGYVRGEWDKPYVF
jgi:prepilin-type processing-associated H-X9-DG protein